MTQEGQVDRMQFRYKGNVSVRRKSGGRKITGTGSTLLSEELEEGFIAAVDASSHLHPRVMNAFPVAVHEA